MDNNTNLFDLVLIFCRWIGSVCNAFGRMCTNSLRLCLRYWFLSLPIIIVFTAIAIYYSRLENRIYKVDTIVYLNGPKAEDVKQVFQPLTYAYPIFAQQELGELLNLNNEQVSGLHRFETFNVIDYLNDSTADVVDYKRKHKLTDTVNVVMNNVLCLSFRTKRPDLVPIVGEHILAYLNNNPTLQASFAKRKALLERKSQFCHDQLEKLDSLTSVFYFEQTGSNQVQMKMGDGMILGRREIKLFTSNIINFYNATDYADRELALCTAPVVAQQPFTINPRAVNGRIKCTLLGFLIGYVFACLIAFAVKRREDIKQWYNKEN